MSCNACSCTASETEPFKKICTKNQSGFRFNCSEACCMNCNPPKIFPIRALNPTGLPIVNEPVETGTAIMSATISDSEPLPIIGRPFEELKYRQPPLWKRIISGVNVLPGTFTIGSFVILVVLLVFLLLLSTLLIFA